MITFPIKSPEVTHDGNHSYIVSSNLKGFYHLAVKTFIKRTMSVYLHNILGCRQTTSKVSGSSLTNGLAQVDHIDIGHYRDGRICPLSVKNCYNLKVTLKFGILLLMSSIVLAKNISLRAGTRILNTLLFISLLTFRFEKLL